MHSKITLLSRMTKQHVRIKKNEGYLLVLFMDMVYKTVHKNFLQILVIVDEIFAGCYWFTIAILNDLEFYSAFTNQ